MGATRFQGAQDDIQHCLCLLEHLVIPESDHSKSLPFNFTVTTLIIRKALLVLATVKLDYEFCLDTSKIRDVAGNRNLPSKAEVGKLSTA